MWWLEKIRRVSTLEACNIIVPSYHCLPPFPPLKRGTQKGVNIPSARLFPLLQPFWCHLLWLQPTCILRNINCLPRIVQESTASCKMRVGGRRHCYSPFKWALHRATHLSPFVSLLHQSYCLSRDYSSEIKWNLSVCFLRNLKATWTQKCSPHCWEAFRHYCWKLPVRTSLCLRTGTLCSFRPNPAMFFICNYDWSSGPPFWCWVSSLKSL